MNFHIVQKLFQLLLGESVGDTAVAALLDTVCKIPSVRAFKMPVAEGPGLFLAVVYEILRLVLIALPVGIYTALYLFLNFR